MKNNNSYIDFIASANKFFLTNNIKLFLSEDIKKYSGLKKTLSIYLFSHFIVLLWLSLITYHTTIVEKNPIELKMAVGVCAFFVFIFTVLGYAYSLLKKVDPDLKIESKIFSIIFKLIGIILSIILIFVITNFYVILFSIILIFVMSFASLILVIVTLGGSFAGSVLFFKNFGSLLIFFFKTQASFFKLFSVKMLLSTIAFVFIIIPLFISIYVILNRSALKNKNVINE